MTDSRYTAPLRIPADHPSLPGHFPGRPVVPGVMLLDRVAIALEAWRGEQLCGVLQVKFLAPLLPEQQAELALEMRAAGRYAFRIRCGDMLVASGDVEAA
jgi:3-hydroxymyristoyl/3-hydroxydecanoyl-(acyl carrier protein) dehydratase